MWVEINPINPGYVYQIKIDLKNDTDITICLFEYIDGGEDTFTLKAINKFNFTNFYIAFSC